MDENIRDTPSKTETIIIGDTEFTVHSLESESASKTATEIIKRLILSNINSKDNA